MNSEFLVTFSDRNFLNKNFTNKCTTMCSNCTIQSIQLDYLLSPYQTYRRFFNYPSLGIGITVFLMWKPPPGLPSSLFFQTSSARNYIKCETRFGLCRKPFRFWDDDIPLIVSSGTSTKTKSVTIIRKHKLK